MRTKGFRLVETAANASVQEAWFELGNLLRLGVHVPIDLPEAIAAYRKAAEKGHVRAQHALANMYGNGQGAGVDLVTAGKWWRLAARKGHELAGQALRLATSMMTSAEISRARRAAEDWIASRSVGDGQARRGEVGSCYLINGFRRAKNTREVAHALSDIVARPCGDARSFARRSRRRVPSTPDQIAQPGGDLPGDPEIALVKVADGFLDPINVTNAGDGSGRIFVVERAGRIKIVNADGSVNEDPFLDLTAINPLGNDVQTGFVEQGLYAVAFHPNYSENGFFYVHYASLPFNGDGVIVRFQVDPASPDVLTPERTNETAKVLMRIEQPWYNHNGGQIEFGPDGFLYIGSGDGGWEGDPYEAGQDLSTPLAKMLRIDVDVEDDSIAYKIPADNPYASAASERLMVLFGHHRGGVRHDQDALASGDLGLRCAQSLRVCF